MMRSVGIWITLGIFLLLTVIGQGASVSDCVPVVSSASCTTCTLSFRQADSPARHARGMLLCDRMNDLTRAAIPSDNHNSSKFKSAARLLGTLQLGSSADTTLINNPTHNAIALHADAVTYYIFALRRIEV